MLRSAQSHLTYVNVALALALCLALAGGALAASNGGETRKANHTIRFEDGIVRGCITKDKVVVLRERGTKCNGLQAIAWNIQGQTGAQGPKGDTGERGPTGTNGADGKDGADGEDGSDATGGGGGGGQVTVRTNSDGLPTDCIYDDMDDEYSCEAEGQSLRASCATGERAVGGGWKGDPKTTKQGRFMTEDRPDPESGTPTGWVVTPAFVQGPEGSGQPPSSAPKAPFSVYVLCQAG